MAIRASRGLAQTRLRSAVIARRVLLPGTRLARSGRGSVGICLPGVAIGPLCGFPPYMAKRFMRRSARGLVVQFVSRPGCGGPGRDRVAPIRSERGATSWRDAPTLWWHVNSQLEPLTGNHGGKIRGAPQVGAQGGQPEDGRDLVSRRIDQDLSGAGHQGRQHQAVQPGRLRPSSKSALARVDDAILPAVMGDVHRFADRACPLQESLVSSQPPQLPVSPRQPPRRRCRRRRQRRSSWPAGRPRRRSPLVTGTG